MSTNDVKPNKGDPELFAMSNCCYFNRPDVLSVIMNLKPVEKNIRRNRCRNKKETRKDIFVKNSKGKFSRGFECCF